MLPLTCIDSSSLQTILIGKTRRTSQKAKFVREVNEIPTFSGADVLAQLKALKPAGEGKGKGKGKATGKDEGEGKGKGKGKKMF